MIRVVHPGSRFFTHPGSRGPKGTGSRIRIRNTVAEYPVTSAAAAAAAISSGECFLFRRLLLEEVRLQPGCSPGPPADPDNTQTKNRQCQNMNNFLCNAVSFASVLKLNYPEDHMV
jgi:hypothetical protein